MSSISPIALSVVVLATYVANASPPVHNVHDLHDKSFAAGFPNQTTPTHNLIPQPKIHPRIVVAKGLGRVVPIQKTSKQLQHKYTAKLSKLPKHLNSTTTLKPKILKHHIHTTTPIPKIPKHLNSTTTPKPKIPKHRNSTTAPIIKIPKHRNSTATVKPEIPKRQNHTTTPKPIKPALRNSATALKPKIQKTTSSPKHSNHTTTHKPKPTSHWPECAIYSGKKFRRSDWEKLYASLSTELLKQNYPPKRMEVWSACKQKSTKTHREKWVAAFWDTQTPQAHSCSVEFSHDQTSGILELAAGPACHVESVDLCVSQMLSITRCKYPNIL